MGRELKLERWRAKDMYTPSILQFGLEALIRLDDKFVMSNTFIAIDLSYIVHTSNQILVTFVHVDWEVSKSQSSCTITALL